MLEELAKVDKSGLIKTGRAYVKAFTDKEEAKRMISEIEREIVGQLQDWYMLGLASFVAGDFDKSFGLLERAYKENESTLMNVKMDYELAPVRNDSLYFALVERMHLD
jgi:hypothetical protein